MPSTPAPDGWQWSSLTDLARLESGHTPSRRHPEYWGGTIPWISISDARAHDGKRIEDTEEKTNELGIENSSARVLPKNTVCLSRTASVGYVVVMARPMATSQDFVNWVCSKQLDHNFLKYLLIAEDEDLLRFASGSVHQTIYFPEVKAFHICHPPLPEQQRIVGILDEALTGIATAKANAEENLRNARALFESHLQSIFTQRGPGWVEKRLADLSRINYGYTESASAEKVGPHFLRITDIQDNRVDWSTVPYCSIEASDYPKYKLENGDIVFARTGATTGKSYLVTDPPESVFASYLIRVRLGATELLPQFVNLFFQTPSYWDTIRSGVSGSAQGGFNATKLGGLVIPFPRLAKEQQAIVAKLDRVSIETQRLATIYERKLAALEALKKSLLHQAFSGNV
jgi:type I restriction enzyme S subunit